MRLSELSPRPGIVGSVERKHVTYNVWTYRRDEELSDEHPALPGEELSTLSVLLPRSKKGGKLYQSAYSLLSLYLSQCELCSASKPVTRHVVIMAPLAKPSAQEAKNADSPTKSFVHRNPPRFAYPEELLTHRFMPYGSESAPSAPVPKDTDVMEVDPSAVSLKEESTERASGAVSPQKETMEKGKKRKSGEESPKAHRTKKAKT